MRKGKLLISNLLLALLLAGFMPQPAGATDHKNDANGVVHLYATSMTGPLGVVRSFGAARINSRVVMTTEAVWPGQMIQATGRNVQLAFDRLGEVRLKRGAIAKFSMARTAFDNAQSGDVLVVALLAGDIDVRLEANVGAYVETAGSAFMASPKASFRVATDEAGATVHTVNGTVNQATVPQRKYVIRPVGLGSNVSVRARGSRQIQVQVTDEHNQPVPDVPVVFALASIGGGGSLGAAGAVGGTLTVTTTAQGIATASFTAGTTAASSSVTATVAGTSISTSVGVTTTATAGILTGTTVGIVAGVAAGATAAVVAVKKSDSSGSSTPVTLQPPNITPRP